MAPAAGRQTYRVRQIPAHCSQFHDLARLLAYVLDYHKTITVRSLASSIDSFENPPTKVATVTFEDEPDQLRAGQNPARSEWCLPAAVYAHNLIIDSHFRGFTPLNEVDMDHHILDCIAITGLSGHAFGSWCAQDRTVDFMWLRDALPRRYPRMRVLTYGYDSHLLGSQSFQSIREISLALITKMRSIGLAEPSSKPLLFLAHSLGGIVVKEAIARIANSPPLEATFMWKVKRVIFFGVPNRGMRISHLLPLVEQQPNEPLVQTLAEGSSYLEHLDAQFYGISSMRQVDLVSIYETHKSPTPQLSSDGQWKKDGPYEILVQLESAIQRGTKPENQHPIDKDHSSLVKFNENEDDLTAVVFFLRSLYESLDGRTRVGHAQQSKKGFSAADRVAGSESETAVDLLSQSQKEQTLKSILESIHFEDAEFRYSMVEQAHGRTFDWLLRQPRVGVLNWLRWGTGIFWISGKPGSGKSTAMKHIYRWYNTSQQHSSDTVSSQEIAARFFFFQRGSVIQKSYEGLLRSLLHQILLKLGLSCVNIFPEWFKPATKSPKEWSFHRLDRLWDQLMGQKHSKLNLILFLDALDEFDGSAEKVALFIKKTVHRSSESMTKVRICCASRPWDAFADSFKSCPTFQMEDHTEPDIRQFVMDTMSTHEAMKPWLRSSLRLERQPLYELMDEILRQAKGVFIWVRLVLQEMLDARTEGAEIDELRRMIGQLPHELEDLYQALLARVKKPEFRQETYAMLEILIRSPRPLQLTEFAWILRCAVAPDLEHSVRGLQQLGEELSSAEIDTLRRRIRSRCGGLVEIVRRPQDDDKVSKQLSLEKVNAPTGSSVAEDDSGSSSRAEIFQEQVTGFAGSLPPPTRDHGPVQVSAPDVRLPSTAFWASQIPYAQFGGWQHPSLAHRGWAPGLYAPPPALVPPASSYLAPFGSHPLPYTSMHSIPSPFPPYLNFAQPGGFLPGPYAASYSPWTTNTADQLHSHFLQSNGGFAYQGHAPDAFAPPFTGGNPNSPAPNNNKTPDAQQHVPHPRRGLPGFSRGTIGETSGVPNKNTPAYPNRSGNQQSVYMVQLMHQTVKEFVTSPGFKGSLGVDHSDMKSENGHSYFAKFGFTLIKSVVRRRGKVFSRIPWLSADKAHNLFALCGDSFHNAEKTTGFAQSSLLDDLDAGQFTCFFPQQRYDAEAEEDAMKDYRPRRWPIDSQISFAAVMRLPLYLKAKFSREQNWLFSREPRILHNIIEKFHFWPRFDAIRPSITMLQQGASVHNTFENLTVFQALFRKIDPTGDPGTFSMTFGQLARLLLENGSDPNCDIFYLFDNIESFEESPELYTSKALHLVLSSPDMVRLMIEYGADVNGRNGRGETPLDVLAELWMTRWTEHVTMDDVELHSAAILINNGGLASRKSYKFLNFRRGGAEDDGDEDEDDDDDDAAINMVDEDDDDGRYTAYDSKYGRLFEDTADWTLRQQGEQVFDLDALRYWDTPSEFDSPRPPQSRPQLELAAVESDW